MCADAGQEAVCRDAVCAVVLCCVCQFESHTWHWCPLEAQASEIYGTAQSIAEAAYTCTPGACHSVTRSIAVHISHRRTSQASSVCPVQSSQVHSPCNRGNACSRRSQQAQTKPPSILEQACQTNNTAQQQQEAMQLQGRPQSIRSTHSTHNLHASTPSKLLINHHQKQQPSIAFNVQYECTRSQHHQGCTLLCSSLRAAAHGSKYQNAQQLKWRPQIPVSPNAQHGAASLGWVQLRRPCARCRRCCRPWRVGAGPVTVRGMPQPGPQLLARRLGQLVLVQQARM